VKITNKLVRTIPGQMVMLAVLFAGGLLLAVAALATRGVLFEPYVRDQSPKPTDIFADELRTLAEAGVSDESKLLDVVDRGHMAALDEAEKKRVIPRWPGDSTDAAKFQAQLERRAKGELPEKEAAAVRLAEREALYGAWLRRPDIDPHDRLARSLLSFAGADTLPLIRRTLVTGTPPERQQALRLLALVPPELASEASDLASWAAEQARRRGEIPPAVPPGAD
jgi:hypothetical protein